jgi:hypothetical protein
MGRGREPSGGISAGVEVISRSTQATIGLAVASAVHEGMSTGPRLPYQVRSSTPIHSLIYSLNILFSADSMIIII